MMAAKRFLQHREPIGRGRQALDGADFGAVDLRREREARAREPAVDLHGAGAADAVLAADMGAGEAERVAQEIGQQHARLGLERAAVDREADAVTRGGAQTRYRRASAIVSLPSLRTRARR